MMGVPYLDPALDWGFLQQADVQGENNEPGLRSLRTGVLLEGIGTCAVDNTPHLHEVGECTN
jgi:hypothetical protein